MIDTGCREAQYDDLPSRFLQNYFENEIQILETWKDVSSWNETERVAYLREFANPTQPGHGDLLYSDDSICDAILFFRATNGVRRHVLISHMNENWGAFSMHIPDRTIDWSTWGYGLFKEAGCTDDDLWWYLNHPNVSAVFTTTHQNLDHPKVLPLPLGVTTSAKPRLAQELTLQGTKTINSRTELLLIANREFLHRRKIVKRVIANFNGTIRNRFKDGSDYFHSVPWWPRLGHI